MEERDPLFIAEPLDKESVAKSYNKLIAADGRNPLSCLRALIYHTFGKAGHLIMWGSMASAKTRYRSSVLAFDGYLLAQDEMLHDIEESGKPEWAWTSEFAIKGGFRAIGNKVTNWGDQDYVRFDYNEIVAAFYSKKMVVLRFCWGEHSWDTWDVIIGTDDFRKGTLDAFLEMVEPTYKDRPTADSIRKHEENKSIRLTSYSANPQLVGRQHKVKVYDRRHAWIP